MICGWCGKDMPPRACMSSATTSRNLTSPNGVCGCRCVFIHGCMGAERAWGTTHTKRVCIGGLTCKLHTGRHTGRTRQPNFIIEHR